MALSTHAQNRPLLVVDNNIENLETPGERPCSGDWKDLIYAVEDLERAPDIFLVQQLSGQKQMKELIAFMEKHYRTEYGGRVADAEPHRMLSPCGADKQYQTNAVISGKDRLRALSGAVDTWQAGVWKECRNNSQARTKGISVGLQDRATGKKVLAGSIHWATRGSGGGTQCAVFNAKRLANRMDRGNYDLRIAGGDVNVSDRNADGEWRNLHTRLEQSDYRDVIRLKCRAGDGPVRACLNDNATGGSHRIDFLWVKSATYAAGPHRVARARTISFAQGDRADRFGGDVSSATQSGRYSDHRALMALVYD